MQFYRIAWKWMLLDATSAKCSRKKFFDDINSESQFWSWIFNSGSNLIFHSGSIFLFFIWMKLKVNSWFSTQGWILILLMMTQGRDSFIFGFRWMTLGQEFHLFFFSFFLVQFQVKVYSLIGDSRSRINFDWEVVCSSLRLKWLILEFFF